MLTTARTHLQRGSGRCSQGISLHQYHKLFFATAAEDFSSSNAAEELDKLDIPEALDRFTNTLTTAQSCLLLRGYGIAKMLQ